MFSRAFILALLLPGVASSADWPHIRGPSYNAISQETGLADQWPDAGPAVLWTRDLGPGYSAFVVVAVGFAVAWSFLVGFVPALPFAVLANSRATGKLRWLWEGLGFVIYFWASALFPGLKAAWGI